MRLPRKRKDETLDHSRDDDGGGGTVEILPRDLLVNLTLEKSLTAEEKACLVSGQAMSIVIAVPDAAWVSPVTEALRELSPNAYVLGRHAVQKETDHSALVDRIMLGCPVIGVSQDPADMLPKILLDTAERRIEVDAVDAEMVEKVCLRFLKGPLPGSFREVDYSRLGLDELCSLLPMGSLASTAIERIVKVVSDRTLVGQNAEMLPRLEEAIEFGAARDWGLALRDDLADLRIGKTSWQDIDRGAVLYGPPGTGKTLFAKMLGRACGIPTIVASLSDYFAKGSGYLDAVIKQQRAVFEEARSRAPCVLFLDELNSLPPDSLEGRNRDYWMPVILDFYVQLDGAVTNREGVIVIGATNRLQDISPALLRPGRLERSIFVGPPDAVGGMRILRHHLAGALESDDITGLAAMNADRGATGAVIMEQCRAARRLARRSGRAMVYADLAAQIAPIDKRTEEQVRRTAVHESGHAVVAALLGNGVVSSISILTDGASDGSTRLQLEKLGHQTIAGIEDLVTVMLAGRAAEQLVLGSPSLGAGGDADSDLGHATWAISMAYASGGLGESLLYLGNDEEIRGLLASDRNLRRQVETKLASLFGRALDLLTRNRGTLEEVVKELIKEKHLSGPKLDLVLAPGPQSAGSSKNAEP